MSAKEVLEIIKNSVKTNLSYIDKVIIVCSGRIEGTHQKAIRQFMDWLQFQKFKEKFVFIHNKSEALTEAQKIENIHSMCEIFGADTKSQAKRTQQCKKTNLVCSTIGSTNIGSADDRRADDIFFRP